MAKTFFNLGVVKVGANTLGEVISVSLVENVNIIEAAANTDEFVTSRAGRKSWSATVEAYFDDTDTAQNALTIGASVTIDVRMEGETLGDSSKSGTAIVESLTLNGQDQGYLRYTMSLRGDGALTHGTVP